MSSVVTLTLNPAIDKSCSVDRVVPEQKLRCSEPQFDPGGGGLNVARAMRQLGGEATALWTCGGLTGERLSELLDDEQLDHVPLKIEALTRENLIVFEESTGQQYRFGMPGATLTEPEIESCVERLQGLDPHPRYLVLSGSLPPDVEAGLYARIAESVPGTCRVILDASGEPLVRALDAPIYLLKPNIKELEQIAGQPVESDAEIRQVSRKLVDGKGVKVVVVSLGSGGAVVTIPDEQFEIRAPTVKIRSKVGAGDSMVAGIVLALSRGGSVKEAVRFGVAAGAAAVMTDGTALCRRSDTERLYQEMQASGGSSEDKATVVPRSQ